MKPAHAFSLLLSLVALSSASAAWQKLPTVEKRHVETGVSTIKGAKLVSSNGIGQADSLMSDDPIAAATLPAGTSEAVINLGKQRVVSFASFVNDSIEGKVTISGSTDMKSWSALAQQVFTPADRQASMDFAGFQGKYIKIQFELSKGGVIRHFQLIGADTDKDFKVQQSGSGGTKLNLANGIGGSRVIYVHPSPNKRGDVERAQNKFDFPESDEKYRTIIYDLGTTRTISEFGSVHSPRPVRFEVFTFDQLPEKEDWRGRLSFDPQAFEATQPVAQAEDPRGVGYIKVKTQKPVKARYVALRWEPDFNPPAFTVGGTSITGGGFEEVEDTTQEQGTGQDDGTGQDTPVTEDGSEKDDGNMGGGGPLTGYGTSGYAGGGGSLPSGGTTTGGSTGGTSGGGGGGGGGGSTVVIQQAADQPASPIQ